MNELNLTQVELFSLFDFKSVAAKVTKIVLCGSVSK